MNKYFFTIFLMVGTVLIVNSCAQSEVENAFPALDFSQPVDLQDPGDNTNRLFVVEKAGIISVFQNSDDAKTKGTFLDIRERVNSGGSEEGLLGLAFHPHFQNSQYFYVDYTAANPRRTVISRFVVSSANPDSADPNSETVILEVSQPFSNHNGGQIAFGSDGYLYIALGDGGSGGDPDGNGQNRATLLGSILRIDVNTTSGGRNYAIPPDNPFAANTNGYREEIFAYGLRNPWRFSFDPVTKKLWAGDVGQNLYEEIDIIEKGRNYGWNIMEGFHCYNSAACDTAGLTLPVWEYGHNSSGGIAVTGGFVYRGTQLPELYGKYIYADYGSGRIWSLSYSSNDTVNTELLKTSLNISSFGTDRFNELYMCAFDGKIYRFKLAANGLKGKLQNKPAAYSLKQNYPNPFNPVTNIPFFLRTGTRVEIAVFNVKGSLIKMLTDKFWPAGEHILSWNGRNEYGIIQPSGIYFCRMQVGGITNENRRMLLLK
ncbi:MAG: PQQ-dependent sugar dehydrogenase [Calditrichia bacterium]